MKKLFWFGSKLFCALLLLLEVCTLNSCQKTDTESKEQGEVSIIGEWESYNLDILDQFAMGVSERKACNDMKVVFTHDGMATFSYDGGSGSYPSVFGGRYEVLEKENVKYINFPEGLFDQNQTAYSIASSFNPLNGGSLVIRFGNRWWDEYEQWYFTKIR